MIIRCQNSNSYLIPMEFVPMMKTKDKISQDHEIILIGSPQLNVPLFSLFQHEIHFSVYSTKIENLCLFVFSI